MPIWQSWVIADHFLENVGFNDQLRGLARTLSFWSAKKEGKYQAFTLT